MNGNSVILTGNLTRDVELKHIKTKNGMRAKAEFSLARSWTVGEVEHAEFFNVECWGPQAENLSKSAGKGTRVTVTGILRQDRWEDKDGGGNRQKVYVEAHDVAIALRFATAEVTKNPKPMAETAEPAEGVVVGPDGEPIEEPF